MYIILYNSLTTCFMFSTCLMANFTEVKISTCSPVYFNVTWFSHLFFFLFFWSHFSHLSVTFHFHVLHTNLVHLCVTRSPGTETFSEFKESMWISLIFIAIFLPPWMDWVFTWSWRICYFFILSRWSELNIEMHFTDKSKKSLVCFNAYSAIC